MPGPRRQWLHYAIVQAASFLTPVRQRAEWRRQWHSELWYVPPHGALRFSLGSFPDALWLRLNTPAGPPLESPLACLAFLTLLAAVSGLLAACLTTPLQTRTTLWHLTPADLPAGCLLTLLLSCLLLPGVSIVGRTAANHRLLPGTLRRWSFLALKIALLQPPMLCGLLAWVLIAPIAPFAPIGILASWFLALRWAIADQQRRCPLCLRLLSGSVRIGSCSRTFLEWHGYESICSHGHGLLHDPGSPATYPPEPQWLSLDPSWSDLFQPVSKGGQS